ALAGRRAVAEGFHWLWAGGMLAAYLLGYRALRAGGGRAAVVVGFAAGLGLLALLLPPFHSIDVYCYANIGWQQVGHGVNPYVAHVDETPGWERDPMFSPYWVDIPSAYGFLFARVARLVCLLGGGRLGGTVLLFEAVNAVALALTAAVVWWGCRRLRRPAPERALYLILWNPLLLVHALGNGHNDVLMALCTAAGACCALAGGWLALLPALAAAALVKYLAAAL